MTKTYQVSIGDIRSRFEIPSIQDGLERMLMEDSWLNDGPFPNTPGIETLARNDDFILVRHLGLVWKVFTAELSVELVKEYTINDDDTFSSIVFPSGIPVQEDDPYSVDYEAWQKTSPNFRGYRRGGYPSLIDGKVCIVHTVNDDRKPLSYLGETVVNNDLYQFYVPINYYRSGDEQGYVIKNGEALHPNLRVEKIDAEKVSGYFDIAQTEECVYTRFKLPEGVVPVENHVAVTLPPEKIGLYPLFLLETPERIHHGDYFIAEFGEVQYGDSMYGSYVFYWNDEGGKGFVFGS